ncbi:MAG TPA: hypothetical protein VM925_21615, partial [Labilithrix sp.]|nr:hypothetical protein [Labilithrix sp.]
MRSRPRCSATTKPERLCDHLRFGRADGAERGVARPSTDVSGVTALAGSVGADKAIRGAASVARDAGAAD